jgi:hypothetical protein
VESLGLYDEVLPYDGELAVDDGALLVDFTGDRALLRRLHTALGQDLKRSVLVGFTHLEAERDADPLPGPEPQLFFAPAEMAKRGGELGRRFGPAWESFQPVLEQALSLEHVGLDAELPQRWRDLAAGRADPAIGLVVQP